MSSFAIRTACAADEDAVIALNARSVQMTAPMDAARFCYLHELSRLMLVAERGDEIAGFLIGFVDDSAYDSVNYRWFASRLRRFFYVDRIVVAEKHRRAGLGRELYTRVIEWAREEGMAWLAAELNVEPLNETSLRFHAAHGFVEVGTQRLDDGKRVSLQIRPLGQGEES